VRSSKHSGCGIGPLDDERQCQENSGATAANERAEMPRGDLGRAGEQADEAAFERAEKVELQAEALQAETSAGLTEADDDQWERERQRRAQDSEGQ